MTEKLIKLIDDYRDACFALAKDRMKPTTIKERKDLEDYNLRYKRALESLTPSGSEFVDDPEYCLKYIRDRQDSQHRIIINQQIRIKKLEENK